MVSEELLRELDIEEGESFAYFEQFAALMETQMEIDDITFAELLLMADREALTEMVSSFFDDIIKGVPDDNMELYRSLESRRDILETLSQRMEGRDAMFFANELYNFREWFLAPETVLCSPEEPGGRFQRMSPCEAMMLYREEPFSGVKYDYDFSGAELREIDEHALAMIDEWNNEPSSGYWREEELEYLPDELPADFDLSDYVPGETDLSELTGRLDPYRDGLIDRDYPVIDDLEEYLGKTF